MSTTLYIAFDKPLDGIEINNERQLLAKIVGEHESLVTLSKQLGVKSLSLFQSYDPQMLAEFIDDPEQRETAMAKAKPIEWFNPDEAIPCIKALVEHYRQRRFIIERKGKSGTKREDRTENLLDELKDLETVLSSASKNDAKFRLYVGF